jgi:hypothetical protein
MNCGAERILAGVLDLLIEAVKTDTDNDKSVRGDTVAREAYGGGYMEKDIKAIDVLVRKGIRNLDFCLILTKDGIVLAKERGRDEIRPGAFGYSSVHIRDHDHPSAENIDGALHDEKNLVIPYDRLRRIHLRRGFSSCTMRREYIVLLNYLDASKKARRLSTVLMPPPDSKGRDSWNRLDRTAAVKHAMEIKEILSEAFPESGVFVADV